MSCKKSFGFGLWSERYVAKTDFLMFLKDIQSKKSIKLIAKNPLVLVYEVNGRKWIAKNPLNLFLRGELKYNII